NKIDTHSEEEMQEVHAMMDLYGKIGYPCREISAKSGYNLDWARKKMNGKTILFAGHSGTGKSTLTNKLEPGLNLKTARTSTQHQQGTHTTTFAEMHDLTYSPNPDENFYARIIDTPGI